MRLSFSSNLPFLVFAAFLRTPLSPLRIFGRALFPDFGGEIPSASFSRRLLRIIVGTNFVQGDLKKTKPPYYTK